MSTKPSMIENGLKTAAGDRIMVGRLNLEAMKDRVGEPLEWDEVGTRGVAIQAELETGLLPLIMAHRDQFHKHTLFR